MGRGVVGAFVIDERLVAIEEVSTTESIIVGNTVEGSIEDAIEVVSIEEEARELIFEVGRDVEGRGVDGLFVVGC